MATLFRSPQDLARLTLAAISGGSLTHPADSSKDWLGYSLQPGIDGASRVNVLLLKGASMKQMTTVRRGISPHFTSLRRRFGCKRAGVDDPIGCSNGTWRFDVSVLRRLAGEPLNPPPSPSPTSKPAEADAGMAELISSAGAGFGTSDQNRRVEHAAMDAVTRDYKARGWKVIDRSREKLGYDLECRSGKSVERVEVKGISGSGQACVITAGEVEFARTDPTSIVCLVTNALTAKPAVARYPGAVFVTRFALSPIAFRATL